MQHLLHKIGVAFLLAAALVAVIEAKNGGGGSRSAGASGGTAGPQIRGPEYTPAWEKNRMAKPSWERRLQEADADTGPSAHEDFNVNPGDLEGVTTMLKKPAAPDFEHRPGKQQEPDTEEGGPHRLLLDGGVSGPAAWQYRKRSAPLTAKVWMQDKFPLPRDAHETKEGGARRLMGGGLTGPSAHEDFSVNPEQVEGVTTKLKKPASPDFEHRRGQQQEAAEEEGGPHRRLMDGGVSGPAAWQYRKRSAPLTAKVWMQDKFPLPRDAHETKEGGARRLMGGGLTGPSAHEDFSVNPEQVEGVTTKLKKPASPDFEHRRGQQQEAAEEEGGPHRRLMDGGISGPAAWQYEKRSAPLTAKVWMQDKFPLPRDAHETKEGGARRLMGGGLTGPSAHDDFSVNPEQVEGVTTKLKKPASPDFEHRRGQQQEAAEEEGGPHRRLMGGPAALPQDPVKTPACYPFWTCNPVNEKVWQGEKPAVPKGLKETHNGARRLLGGGSGPGSYVFWGGSSLNSKVWQWQKPALPRGPKETKSS